jgi:hypothetical protein
MSWFSRKKSRRLSPGLARIFEKLQTIIEDENLQNESMPELIKAEIDWSKSVDTVPNSWGEFGRNLSNPIPVNGPLGEILYLSSIRLNDGRRIAFHRLGSVNEVDVFETVSFDGDAWSVLYVNMYYARKSKRTPEGFQFVSANEHNTSLIRGTNHHMANFPSSIFQTAAECSKRFFAFSIADPDLKLLDKRAWTRPPRHLALLGQLKFGGRVEASPTPEVNPPCESISTGAGIDGRPPIAMRFPRIIPLFWAIIYTVVALALMAIWQPPAAGLWHWVRWAVISISLLFALQNWWNVFFMPAKRIRQVILGEADASLLEVGGKPLTGRRLWTLLAILVAGAIALHFWRPDIWGW